LLLSVSVGGGYFVAGRTSVWLAFIASLPALTLVFTFMRSSPVTTIEVSRRLGSGRVHRGLRKDPALRDGLHFLPSLRRGVLRSGRSTPAGWACWSPTEPASTPVRTTAACA